MRKLRNGKGIMTAEQKRDNKINEIVDWINEHDARTGRKLPGFRFRHKSNNK